MKNKFLLILTVIMILGCNDQENLPKLGKFEDQGLGKDTELKVLKSSVKYLNKEYKTDRYDINNTSICRYFGTFSENIVFMVSLPGIHHQSVTLFCFSGIVIAESYGGVRILVWKAGSVYHITKAYKEGLLTQTDILDLAEINTDDIYVYRCEGKCERGRGDCFCLECNCKLNQGE